ncbi:hypothetical protein V6Z11_1Z066500 [Gossypium hirsutum]
MSGSSLKTIENKGEKAVMPLFNRFRHGRRSLRWREDGATPGDGRAARRQRQVRMGRSERQWQRSGYCRGVRCTWGN